MIDPVTSWFEIVELPTVAQEMTVPPMGKGKKVTFDTNTKVAKPYFDKSSAQISNLVYRLVWAKKLLLAAIGLVFPALVLGYKSFNHSSYHVPVSTLIEKFV
jgi:hypothetical protein